MYDPIMLFAHCNKILFKGSELWSTGQWYDSLFFGQKRKIWIIITNWIFFFRIHGWRSTVFLFVYDDDESMRTTYLPTYLLTYENSKVRLKKPKWQR